MTKAITRWWWLRHAPVPDSENRIIGRLDPPCDLSDTDRLSVLARLLPRQSVVVESGMLRCTQTLGAIESAGLTVAPAILESALLEQDFGRWQGRRWAELDAKKDPEIDAFWRDPAASAPPGGESFVAVMTRVRAAVTEITRHFEGRDIIAIAHAGSIRAALALALDLSPQAALSFVIDPLSLTRLDCIGEGWRVGGVNMSGSE